MTSLAYFALKGKNYSERSKNTSTVLELQKIGEIDDEQPSEEDVSIQERVGRDSGVDFHFVMCVYGCSLAIVLSNWDMWNE